MARPLLAVSLVALLLTGCGAGTSAPAWRSAHPDPNGMTFDEQAPGICAITVQYPDLAPASIEYQGTTFVQRARAPAPAQPPGQVLARSLDWTISAIGTQLVLDTGADLFTYRAESSC